MYFFIMTKQAIKKNLSFHLKRTVAEDMDLHTLKISKIKKKKKFPR